MANRRYTWILVAAGGLAVLAGCVNSDSAAQTYRVPASALPQAVAYVETNRTTFAEAGNDALAEVAAGTEMDDLNGLDSCWGTYYVLTTEPAAGATTGTPVLNGYEAFQFDAATGAAAYQIYQDALSTELSIFASYEGTYTVLDTQRIQVTWDTVVYFDPYTGQIHTETLAAGDEGRERTYWMTLSGDKLRVRAEDEAASDDGTDGYDRRVYSQFDCP
ncbi:MAG: hypothetical protein PVJ57_00395 [Phycisphaerae bacterium]|jgi:hypothetical protein